MTIQAKNPFPANVTELSITNADEQKFAEELIVRGKRLYKEIKAHYDGLIKPIKETIAKTVAERDEKLNKIQEALDKLKTKLTAYIDFENEKRQKEVDKKNQQALAAATKEVTATVKALIKEGKVEEALELKAEPLPVPRQFAEKVETGDSISRVMILDWEITDASAIPEFYYKPRELDTKKVREAGLAGNEIAGIRFFRKATLAVRA